MGYIRHGKLCAGAEVIVGGQVQELCDYMRSLGRESWAGDTYLRVVSIEITLEQLYSCII